MFGKLRDDLRLKLRILLESKTTNKTEEHVVKAQNFYRACMNLSKLFLVRKFILIDKKLI